MVHLSPMVDCAWHIRPQLSPPGIVHLHPSCWTNAFTSHVCPGFEALKQMDFCNRTTGVFRFFFFKDVLYMITFASKKKALTSQAFVTHFGKCIDEKTPLLRSMDAVKTHGLRMLKAIGIGTDAQTMHSYLGWEQEFLGESLSEMLVKMFANFLRPRMLGSWGWAWWWCFKRQFLWMICWSICFLFDFWVFQQIEQWIWQSKKLIVVESCG